MDQVSFILAASWYRESKQKISYLSKKAAKQYTFFPNSFLQTDRHFELE